MTTRATVKQLREGAFWAALFMSSLAPSFLVYRESFYDMPHWWMGDVLGAFTVTAQHSCLVWCVGFALLSHSPSAIDVGVALTGAWLMIVASAYNIALLGIAWLGVELPGLATIRSCAGVGMLILILLIALTVSLADPVYWQLRRIMVRRR